MSSKENLKDALIRSRMSNSELRKELGRATDRIVKLEKDNLTYKLTIAFLREENKPKMVKWFNRLIMKIFYVKKEKKV